MNLTIKEIKEKLQDIKDKDDSFIKEYQNDPRKGVQNALRQWHSSYEKREKLRNKFQEMSFYEQKIQKNGYHLIAGIDEVGRGPLAGPVVAAAVILDQSIEILGLDDSKKISKQKRNELFKIIHEKALGIGIGVVNANEIDQLNILQATHLAMKKAVEDLDIVAEFLLVDAILLNMGIPEQKLYQGDQKSNSIAAASIIAKVTRDELMCQYDQKYPGYSFSNHSGYGTKEHLSNLEMLGPTPIHRKSFEPVKKLL